MNLFGINGLTLSARKFCMLIVVYFFSKIFFQGYHQSKKQFVSNWVPTSYGKPGKSLKKFHAWKVHRI